MTRSGGGGLHWGVGWSEVGGSPRSVGVSGGTRAGRESGRGGSLRRAAMAACAGRLAGLRESVAILVEESGTILVEESEEVLGAILVESGGVSYVGL
uniref:Uncharacterized protein n=1 Tax=Oryza brachyantha TaxID=4533 RepID=J3MW42_ORYBR